MSGKVIKMVNNLHTNHNHAESDKILLTQGKVFNRKCELELINRLSDVIGELRAENNKLLRQLVEVKAEIVLRGFNPELIILH